MATTYTNVEDYLATIPEDRIEAFMGLLETIRANIPAGFQECIQYKMPSFNVPLSTYPDGYHCTKDTPLPFINIANQKNFIALYHMGIYANPEIHQWFVEEYPKHSKYKLDMGKSCIRFKKVDHIPLELIGQLVQKMSVEDWIKIYESKLQR
jgi:uncharacterized protein YdhG (YjbR/CyaY superfamily)